MPGAIAPNLHEGSRSEILADYLLSSWGTVTPVRRQDDYGVDLFCTLTEAVGQRAIVTDYYSVQVKSTDDAWVITGNDAIRWLVGHPTPLFLACVDKARNVLSIYRTLARFLAGFWEPQDRLELIPSAGDVGQCAQWVDPTRFQLSAPILRVTIGDLMTREILQNLRTVFQFWVKTDQQNCNFRQLGLLRLREPYAYRVNELPNGGIAEQGMIRPTEAQLTKAIQTVVEVADCVGHQLINQGDRKAGVFTALLLNHIRTSRRDLFMDDARWAADRPWGTEMEVSRVIEQAIHPERASTYVLQDLDTIAQELAATDHYRRFIS